ncbi:peptidoglycan editing factor PgeF [Aestuariibacter sp. A3R04]|uniref:peptidoglycan editing factor PgeF n=1 Tax=Aestuariibacter sp. A3R04 TaxID=2841571 RepID=UPI001C08FD98|nr:peptidoglycan editing factor PgeF [Aestuariibacter sp. A3R04]MBU3021916.1 peptidoglycan editing factor PgeF [Aestuariibacter sp. A3R04]
MAVVFPDLLFPKGVFAYCSVRQGGYSSGAYGGLNVAMHVGDDDSCVAKNRKELPFHHKIHWLEQVHGNDCITLPSHRRDADASISRHPAFACGVMTADCVPVLLSNVEGTEVAAIHAGWKGLASGIIPQTLSEMKSRNDELVAWIGPAISQPNYEVSADVVAHFEAWRKCYRTSDVPGKYLLDLPDIAFRQLHQAGVGKIANSGLCTYERASQFFSHRRSVHNQTAPCGRQVSVIGFKL